MTEPIWIDSDRLWQSLQDLAKVGATAAGGVTRLALTDEDKAGRDLLSSWMQQAGLRVRVDDLGNMTGVRPGITGEPPVLLGSHIDTVVRGGKYDGALGVLAALEVIRTLNDHNIITRRPLAMVNWTNEEGVRFEPAMQCSGAVAGRFTREQVYAVRDRLGVAFGDELARIGYRGEQRHRPFPASAYLELHIEQGAVLEAAGQAVGVVGGIVGITWLEVTIQGQSDHAGPSPMHSRHDALVAAAEIIAAIAQIAIQEDDIAVATVGRISAEPNVINTIPGRVVFSVDFRHPSTGVLERLVDRLTTVVADVCTARGVAAEMKRFWTSEPTPFAPEVVAAIRRACAACNIEAGELWSGAGHDAKYLADIVPSGMIFVRSKGGLSHCEQEESSQEDIAAGANVLLHAALALAG